MCNSKQVVVCMCISELAAALVRSEDERGTLETRRLRLSRVNRLRSRPIVR